MAAAVIVAALAAGFGTWAFLRADTPRVVRRLEATVTPLAIGGNRRVAITKDGAAIVYLGTTQTPPSGLFVRRIDQFEAPQMLVERDLSIRRAGGTVGRLLRPYHVVIEESPTRRRVLLEQIAAIDNFFRGATWGDDGSIVFALAGTRPGLYRIPASGGEPQLLAKPDREAGEGNSGVPRLLPGSRGLLFHVFPPDSSATETANMRIAVLDLRSSKPTPKILVSGGSDPRFVASGHIVYLSGSTLRAVAFDAERLERIGSDVEVLSEVAVGTVPILGDFDVAGDGTLVFSTALSATGSRTMVWVDDRTARKPFRSCRIELTYIPTIR